MVQVTATGPRALDFGSSPGYQPFGREWNDSKKNFECRKPRAKEIQTITAEQ